MLELAGTLVAVNSMGPGDHGASRVIMNKGKRVVLRGTQKKSI